MTRRIFAFVTNALPSLASSRAAQRTATKLGVECLETRQLLAADLVIPLFASQTHGWEAPVESEDLSQAGSLVFQLDTDRALFRNPYSGDLTEMIWEPLDHDHGHDSAAAATGDDADEGPSSRVGELAAADTFTPSGIPLLDSLPTAPAAVFLDFDGNFEPQWGSSSNVITPPYDLDGDPTSFNADEQSRIEEIWLRVKEDFAPFNVNVTTDDPSDAVTPLNQINTSVNRIRTFYFRTEFNVTSASTVSNLMFNILRDDGVAVYLNGVEVVRDNLNGGADYRTLANTSINDEDETVYNGFAINPSLLVNGINEIAVEVHQQSDSSSDVGFDMSVTATVNGTANQILLPTGATWSYLDDGSDQGTAWRNPGFNDSGWGTGSAKFGYGDPDVVTNLEVYEAGAPRVRTYYFRHDFDIANPASVSSLNLGLLRDDGAAVYLNGVEIVRDNLAANATYDDFALSSVGGNDESTFFPFSVPTSALTTGRNVLAVEVHQQSDTSSDVSFDLRLNGTIGGVPNVSLVSAGSDWRYLDDGTNQGTAWRATDFDDATWRNGTAQFGYGDSEVGTVRVAIGSEDWFGGGAGGVAFVNSFNLNGSTTVFAFTNGVGNGAKNLAEVASHEAGHAFGLGHQSTFDALTGQKLEEYNPGSGDWAPIMGVSYGPSLSTWHNGPTGSISNFQDDMAVIARSGNGFGFRPDDHGNLRFNATPLTSVGGSFTVDGIVAQNNDVDMFSFSIAGPTQGGVRAQVVPTSIGPNLNAILEVRNSNNVVVASDDPSNSLGASLDVSLAPGDYTLAVRSNDEYGRVGQYSLIGDLDESLVSIDSFVRTGPLGSQAAVSELIDARVHFANDEDVFQFFGQKFQLLSAAVTPVDATTTLTLDIPGLAGPFTAISPGTAVQLPITQLPADQLYQLIVTGDDPGKYTVQLGFNTSLESPGTSDAAPISITASDQGQLDGRLVVTGFAGDGSDAIETLIPKASTWRYLDNGTNQGTAWIQPTFNDASWSTGKGEFGYGDSDETTILNELGLDGNRVRTFYFRHSFDVTDVTVIENLVVGLKADDGAAVYLNGVEIQRENLATNAAFDTLADGTTDFEEVYLTASVLGGLLRNGSNVVAVEVHQASDTSSDVTFDLELLANVPSNETVRVSAVPAGSVWRYLDDGSNQGTAWRLPTFNDTSWSSGAGELGYGESEVTTLDETTNSGNRVRTFYFRHEFNLGSVSGLDVGILRLLRDDGAAVYLNGTEIRRDNLAANAGFNDLATGTVSGGEESQYLESFFNTSLLVPGRNVLAVEVHQQADSSSDVSFDLELIVEDLPTSATVLFSPGASWKYLDNGSNQGTAWRELNFDDASWTVGNAEFGYGDGDETTELNETGTSGNRVRTFYFRKDFNVANPTAFAELGLSLKYDDGVAVYLNGVELIRQNLAANAGFDDLAPATADDATPFFDYTIDASLLSTGRNVVAVEIHQESDTSSDVTFDMGLTARQASVEVDVFTFDVSTEQLPETWDMLLEGIDADFAAERLELIGPDGSVVAVATAGDPQANYDLGISGVTLPLAGTYMLRLQTVTRGTYGIFVGSQVQLEIEPNSTSGSSINPLAIGQEVWGHAVTGQDVDVYRLSLQAGIPVAFFTSTPFGSSLGQPRNDLDPAISIELLDGTLVASDATSSDGRNSLVLFTPTTSGEYQLRLQGVTGSGEYTLTAAMAGDANLDGAVDSDDFAIWASHRFTSGDVSWSEGDFTGDGSVDVRDFTLWNRYKFSAYPAAAASSRGHARAAMASVARRLTVDVIDEVFRNV